MWKTLWKFVKFSFDFVVKVSIVSSLQNKKERWNNQKHISQINWAISKFKVWSMWWKFQWFFKKKMENFFCCWTFLFLIMRIRQKKRSKIESWWMIYELNVIDGFPCESAPASGMLLFNNILKTSLKLYEYIFSNKSILVFIINLRSWILENSFIFFMLPLYIVIRTLCRI